MALMNNELQRYSRHLNLSEVGVSGQQKLKNSKILCIGAGGLASPVLAYLAAAGIGVLGIIDNDIVELSNLQRQIIFTESDLGKLKVDCAQQKLSEQNSMLEIETYPFRLNADNAFAILSEYDIIVDCTDNFISRYLINDVCFYLQKPNVSASIAQFEGQCSVYCVPGGPCYRCLYDSPPPENLVPNCNEGGVLGVLPGLLGVIQATEVIKLILNMPQGQSLIGSLLTVDALSMEFKKLTLTQRSDCRLCAQQQAFIDLPRYEESCNMIDGNKSSVPEISVHELQKIIDDVFLLDVRQPNEYAICNLQGYLIPLAELEQRLSEVNIDKPIVVYCRSGKRSAGAVRQLQQAGMTNVKNLRGGILAWIKEIDPSMRAY